MDIDVIAKQSRLSHAAVVRYRPMLEEMYVHWARDRAHRNAHRADAAHADRPTPETEADARAAKVLVHAHNIAALVSPDQHD